MFIGSGPVDSLTESIPQLLSLRICVTDRPTMANAPTATAARHKGECNLSRTMPIRIPKTMGTNGSIRSQGHAGAFRFGADVVTASLIPLGGLKFLTRDSTDLDMTFGMISKRPRERWLKLDAHQRES